MNTPATSSIKPLKPIDYTSLAVNKAIEEAKNIIKDAVEKKEDKSCYIYIYINGEVYRAGDFPNSDIEKYHNKPQNSVLVYSI